MSRWVKRGLWVAALVLPGGVLLLPVIVAVHGKERRDRRRTATAPDELST